jgi:thiamine-phosphate pyrophosphorylase
MGNLETHFPRLYAIVDASFFSSSRELVVFADQLAAGGCTLIQYRNKSGNARVMLEQARELKRRLSHSHFSQNRGEVGHPTSEESESQSSHLGGWSGGRPRPPASSERVPRTGASGAPQSVRLIMNDRADLCLAAEFDGVHVGQEDLSPESVRKIIGPDRWLGVSTHNPEQLREADLTSADYLAIGPVFQTSSKEKPDPVVGLEGVRRARALTRKPLVAIGGITRANAASVIAAGADSVAVISDLLRDPRKSAEEFLRILR